MQAFNWEPRELEDHDRFTILVTDIRSSSKVLSSCHAAVVEEFLERFGQITKQALAEQVPTEDEYRINRFVGDGFFILLREPNERARWKEGPSRAVRAAIGMIERFRVLCGEPRWVDLKTPIPSLRLRAGINYGRVFYGPVAKDVIGNHSASITGVVKEVVRAFRMADTAEAESVLVASKAYDELRADLKAGLEEQQQLELQGFEGDTDVGYYKMSVPGGSQAPA